jgi:phage terminase large subunit-like protein
MTTIAARLAALPDEERRALLGDLGPEALAALPYLWQVWARSDQMPPAGDWRTWLFCAGRGAGKTRAASEWVRSEAESGRRVQIGIVGPTSDAVRRIMVEGPSGILAVAPPWCRPTFGPATRTITWPNGAIAHLFSAEEPDRLRGPNLDAAWCDELCAWESPGLVWDMLSMALRAPGPQGHAPQAVVTTTPKASPTLKAIMSAPSTVVTRAKTADNAANLDASTLRYLQDKYGGTTLGRQELDAELLEDVDGALWTRALLDACRVATAPDLHRLVVAVDLSGTRRGDEAGIVVAGRAADGHAYVVADLSCKASPQGWAQRAVAAFHQWRADRIIAEGNFGAEMVEQTIRGVDARVPIKLVHASRGKVVRAEPVVSLYEQRRVHHVGMLPGLEDELCQWTPDGSMPSPGRLDALVWAITELAVNDQPKPARWAYINIIGR